MIQFPNEFSSMLWSKTGIMYIVTEEEERFIEYLEHEVEQVDQQAIYIWDLAHGYYNIPSLNSSNMNNPTTALDYIDKFNNDQNAIFVLKDFSLFISDPSVSRKLRNLSSKLCVSQINLIILSPQIVIPDNLQNLFYVLSFPLPNSLEIKLELNRLFNIFNKNVSSDLLDAVTVSCKGLSINLIRNSISKLCIEVDIINYTHLDFLLNIKRQYVKQTDILELPHNIYQIQDIGGLDNLKAWIANRSTTFSQISLDYGIPYPKGILVIGIQGTGKSMIAKALAHAWNLLLLRLDFGKLFSGIVGQSEEKMRRMINIVEASAPCVLWVDEIDKIFNRSTVDGDSGTNRRLLATFLTWLEDRSLPVFIVATANNVTILPPEIIRKGRFDEIFFVDLPAYQEREQIFSVHLSKLRPHTWHQYNIPIFAKYSKFFSGAEIRQTIINAMCNAFVEQREFNSQDVLLAIKELIPLAITDQETVKSLQNWANLGRARFG